MEILFLISGLEILLIMTFRILRFYKSSKITKKVIMAKPDAFKEV